MNDDRLYARDHAARESAWSVKQLAENITGAVAERSGHWLPEGRPAWLSKHFLGFFSSSV